jgi:hypothetical protein
LSCTSPASFCSHFRRSNSLGVIVIVASAMAPSTTRRRHLYLGERRHY